MSQQGIGHAASAGIDRGNLQESYGLGPARGIDLPLEQKLRDPQRRVRVTGLGGHLQPLHGLRAVRRRIVRRHQHLAEETGRGLVALGGRLLIVGFGNVAVFGEGPVGESKLLDQTKPNSGVNRRVEVMRLQQ